MFFLVESNKRSNKNFSLPIFILIRPNLLSCHKISFKLTGKKLNKWVIFPKKIFSKKYFLFNLKSVFKSYHVEKFVGSNRPWVYRLSWATGRFSAFESSISRKEIIFTISTCFERKIFNKDPFQIWRWRCILPPSLS